MLGAAAAFPALEKQLPVQYNILLILRIFPLIQYFINLENIPFNTIFY